MQVRAVSASQEQNIERTAKRRSYVCRLERKELTVAAMVGAMRYIENVYRETSDKYGAERDWSMDIVAAIGEMAVARLLNEYWAPGTPRSPDLAYHNLEVRSTDWWHGCLILHPEDADDHPFVLVTTRGAEARIAGWCFGIEGKKEQHWTTEPRHPCFMVPQHRLRSPDDLLLRIADDSLRATYEWLLEREGNSK